MADSEDRLEGVPEMPEGKIPIQLRRTRLRPRASGNVLAMVVPMMGSMGVMVFMAVQNGGTRSMMMGGGMLVAMLGMVALTSSPA